MEEATLAAIITGPRLGWDDSHEKDYVLAVDMQPAVSSVPSTWASDVLQAGEPLCLN